MKKYILSLLVAVAVISCSDRPYVVVQVADTQLGFDAAVKGSKPGAEYVNDLSFEAEYLRKAVTAINEIKPDAVVFSGDQVHMPADEEQWNLFGEIISDIDQSIKVLHIPGNHDHFLVEGGVDPTPFTSRFGDDHFVHRDRGVALVGVNTSLIYFNDARESEQFEWLKDALKKEKNSDVTLVFGHHPYFYTSIDETEGHGQLDITKRRTYFDLFKEMGVAAVYAGHMHESGYGEYEGIPMTTQTSAAYQLGEDSASLRVITVSKDGVSDKVLSL